MAAPSFPLVPGQPEPVPGTPVTLALTMDVDPDNPLLGDLHLLNGQVHFWDADDGRRQKIWVVLQFFKGEWWLDRDEGIPYFQSILKKGVSRNIVLSIFRQALLGIPGLAQIKKLNFTLSSTTRVAAVDFEVVFDDAAVIASADFGPVLIRTP